MRPTETLSALVAAVLSACGGGGSSSSSDVQPAAAASCVPVRPVVVQLFGDSTQVGWSAVEQGPTANAPAVALQAHYTLLYGAGAVIVEARAVSGTTAKELVAGADHLNAAWPGSVKAHIVVVNHGINDATHGDDMGTYKAALEKLSRAPAQVIFETPNALRGVDLAPWAQTMRDVAASKGLAVADTYTYTVDKTALLSDWAHPTNELYGMVSVNVLQPAVDRAVAKLRCES